MMHITETPITHAPNIESHVSGCLKINGINYYQAVIVGSWHITELPSTFTPQDLNTHSFQAAIDDKAEVIIIGTGDKQQFLNPQINIALAQQGIGIEYMNTASACRTITLLQSENRNVWAWLWA
ncbi:MAG: Mth938-like domain-containing protein [Alysiella sp.]|nr:Mth938-like domain-containing protein [Alysiella sp.]